MTTPIEFHQGIASSSWRFTAANGTAHLLTLAHLSGWTFTATDADLRYVPVPTIEVRTLALGASSYRTVKRLDIEGATQRHIPWDAAEHAATVYRDAIAAQDTQG
ncbi:hypothetical protein ACIRRA_44570 [Nocardia sp. NPDC101769]|uniref:hypothetical protein n=1 Tax=Nocardia sp. NPDC101769 TaxID=3364333 RepID=UPI0038230563